MLTSYVHLGYLNNTDAFKEVEYNICIPRDMRFCLPCHVISRTNQITRYIEFSYWSVLNCVVALIFEHMCLFQITTYFILAWQNALIMTCIKNCVLFHENCFKDDGHNSRFRTSAQKSVHMLWIYDFNLNKVP